LEKLGYICVEKTLIENGRAREYYAITEEGVAYLAKVVSEYKELSALFLNFVDEEQESK